ncbi:MAG: acetoacetate decarboxylase family protein [Desulfobacterales bacterium]|jgi:hypothetical protein|nr:acetoacetate decarboxylase family protein [Desulfobacterales bacterium]
MKSFGIDRNLFFDGILQRSIPEYNVKLPIFYYEGKSMTAMFTASTRAVRERLPKSLHPVELFPGRSMVAVSAFEYASCDIGPYNEVSIAAVVHHGGKGLPLISLLSQLILNTFKAFIFHLPVTSETARKGAVELSGYPKFLADIEFIEQDSSRTCRLSLNGQNLMTFAGRKPAVGMGPMTRTLVYNEKDGKMIYANFYAKQDQFAQTMGSSGVQLEIGQGHAMCDTLRALSLSSKPLVYQYSPRFQAILFDTKNLIDI